MTHVKISTSRDAGSIVVDGVDISRAVLAEGITVAVSTAPGAPSMVSLTLVADILELDLPEAVVAPLIQAANEGDAR